MLHTFFKESGTQSAASWLGLEPKNEVERGRGVGRGCENMDGVIYHVFSCPWAGLELPKYNLWTDSLFRSCALAFDFERGVTLRLPGNNSR